MPCAVSGSTVPESSTEHDGSGRVELGDVEPRVGNVDDDICGRADGQPSKPQTVPGGPGRRRQRVVWPQSGLGERPYLIDDPAVRPGVGAGPTR